MEYIKQIYNEGMGYLLCVKPIAFFSKNIKNKVVVRVLSLGIKILYTILLLGTICLYIYVKLK